jgi:hypothetical protein
MPGRNRSQKNNNPLNLRFAGQTEANGGDDVGFAVFPNPEAGWRAAHAQINLDQGRMLSLKQFIFKFAPPNENDSLAYLAFVREKLGVPDYCPLVDISVFALAGVMAAMEGYYNK